MQLLDHPYAYVRYWTIRLIGDQKSASRDVVNRLVALAASEPSPAVRSQLAATAKRLPAREGLAIVDALLANHPNESDPRIPWLIWWAIEAKAMSDTDLIVEMLNQDSMWANPAARADILLLIRRFAAEGTAAGYAACLRMLQSVPTQYADDSREQLRQGLAERAVGLQGIGQGGLFGEQAAGAAGDPVAEVRRYESLTPPLKEYITVLWKQTPEDPQRLELALAPNINEAYPALKAAVFRPDLQPAQRAPLFTLLRDFGRPDVVRQLLELLSGKQPDAMKLAALDVLAAFDSKEITPALIDAYAAQSQDVRQRICNVLLSRPGSALAFLQAIDAGQVKADEIPLDQLRRVSLHKNPEIDNIVRKHWGNIGPGSTEEKLATMRRYNNDLRAGSGDSGAGKALFEKHCGVCHQLFGQGNKIGPDMTNANRNDQAALLANIVDPSAVIRREYLNYIVVTNSGRVVTGIIAEQDAASLTILDANNQRIKVSRDEVDELREADVSLMPERLLESLTPQELRDLFAYLRDAPNQ